jgi:hypothetical protein
MGTRKTSFGITAIRKNFALWLVALIILPLLAACSDNNNNGGNNQPPVVDPEPEPEPIAFQEIYDQGITRYMGEYTPMMSEASGDVVNHTFGAGDGPLCIAGGEYTMSTLDAGSEDLVIYLQGGGACWSEFCAAETVAAPGIPPIGIMDTTRENNPVKDWNQVYLPYCDGGLHASDKDSDSDGDDVNDRFQRGLHNLSASLDVAVNTFPTPRRIFLSGSSGGGLGTSFALPLVRYVYPGVPIVLVNDSGVGVSRPDDPDFLRLLMDDWNTGAFIPESCENCIPDDGHFTDYHIWQMDQDDNFRRGMLSYSRDTTFADFFLQIGKDAFEAALFPEMQQLEDAYPERQHSWIPAGEKHTFLMAEPDQTAGGVPVMDWIAAMLDGSDDWVSVQD